MKTIQELMALRKVSEVCSNSAESEIEAWKEAVKKKYPNVASKLKFKSKDNGKNISAEIDGEDRSYGVYDVTKCKGEVLGEDTVVTEDDNTDPDMHELVDKWMDANRVHSFEGPSGVRNFGKLVQALNPDYRDLDSFFSDNYGAFEAVIEWIQNQNIPEWNENLKSQIGDEE